MKIIGYRSLVPLIGFTILNLTSCTKTVSTANNGNNGNTGNNANNNNSTTFSLAYIAPKDGMISVSSERLIMHAGNQANISAQLFNGDGLLASPQPSLAWNSSLPNSVSTTPGIINALAIGDALITIGDGVHANGYVNVSVVADSISIPAGPANISFNVSSLSVQNNSNVTIPSYTITDYQGNIITGSVSFEISDFTNATVANNSIKSNDSSGIGLLVAKFNGNYINGKLPVFVFKSGADTIRKISLTNNYPYLFYSYNQIAKPITVNVYESSGTGFQLPKIYQASPESINIDYPKVISVTGDGHLISNYPGITGITLNYKGARVKGLSGVNIDMAGHWVGSNNNTTYNFSFTKPNTSILYQPTGVSALDAVGLKQALDASFLNATKGGAFIQNNTTSQIQNMICYLYAGSGYNNDASANYAGPYDFLNASFGEILFTSSSYFATYSLQWRMSKDTVKAGDVVIVRGNDTSSNTGNPITLSDILCNGSSKTWVGNDCYNNNTPGTFISAKFSSDGTGVSVDSASGTIGFTWTIDGNNSFTVYDPTQPGYYLIYYVSNYTSNSVSFSKIHEHNPNATPVDSDGYFGEAGCILGFQAQ